MTGRVNRPCVVVKGVQFTHQTVYDGPGDGVHCHFCQKVWPTKDAADLKIFGDGKYPGETFYHANNKNVRETEERWLKRRKN